jgi:hypothetical protein
MFSSVTGVTLCNGCLVYCVGGIMEELLLLNYLLVLSRRTCIFKVFFEKKLYKFTRKGTLNNRYYMEHT